jgi:hypothetical protein
MAGWGWVSRNAGLITKSAHPFEKSASGFRSLATLWFATLLGICGLVLVRFLLGDATLEPHEK